MPFIFVFKQIFAFRTITFPLGSAATPGGPTASSTFSPSLRFPDKGLAVGDVDALPVPFDINGGGPRLVTPFSM